MKNFFRNLSPFEWVVVMALAMFALGVSRDANAGERGKRVGAFFAGAAVGAVVGAAVTAPTVVYAHPAYVSPCPGIRHCYDHPPPYYSPSPYAAGWSAIVRPPVVHQVIPVYPSGQVVSNQPGELERMAAEEASRQAEQTRQLFELARRASDRAQMEQALAQMRAYAHSATNAANAAREIAFREAGGPFAQATMSNAQSAQYAADRANQLVQYASR